MRKKKDRNSKPTKSNHSKAKLMWISFDRIKLAVKFLYWTSKINSVLDADIYIIYWIRVSLNHFISILINFVRLAILQYSSLCFFFFRLKWIKWKKNSDIIICNQWHKKSHRLIDHSSRNWHFGCSLHEKWSEFGLIKQKKWPRIVNKQFKTTDHKLITNHLEWKWFGCSSTFLSYNSRFVEYIGACFTC